MPHKDESKFVEIAVLENAIEAQLIGSILDQRQIPFRLQSYHDTAYNGLYQLQNGWGKLYAPESCRREILQVIEDVRSHEYFQEDDDNHQAI